MQQIGKYQIIKELGKGATGKVYLANDPFARRQVAVKVAFPEALRDSEDGALYRQMFLIRRLEEEAARAYAQGKIGGFLHLYIGQEAVAVGSIATLKPEDYVVTTYRDHGVAIAKGMSPKALMAELAVVPAADHGAFFFGKVATFQALILDFLLRHDT